MTVQKAKQEEGFTLLAAVAALGAISLFTIAYMLQSDSNTTNSGLMMQRRGTLYLTEGLRNAAMYEVGQYLTTYPNPTPSTIANVITSKLPGYLPSSQYTLPIMNVNSVSNPTTLNISTGPYAGLQAQATEVGFQIGVSNRTSLQTFNTTITSDMTIGQIGMFEYNLFSTLGFSNINPAESMTFTGPVYAAGDLCIGGNLGVVVQLDHVSAYGRLMQAKDSRCTYPDATATRPSVIQVPSAPSSPLPLLLAADKGCTNCGGTGLAWRDYAAVRWQGNLQDHDAGGVPLVQLPGQGTNVVTQFGANDNYAQISNGNQMRFLVDPPLMSPAEPSIITQQKFSYHADIRIIGKRAIGAILSDQPFFWQESGFAGVSRSAVSRA